jgi:hypothetical protein
MKLLLSSALMIMVCAAAIPVRAQDRQIPTVLREETSPFGDPAEDFTLIRESPLSIDMEREEELAEVARDMNKKKQEKRKRNEFYGIKTRKGFLRKGVGDNVELEPSTICPPISSPYLHPGDILVRSQTQQHSFIRRI